MWWHVYHVAEAGQHEKARLVSDVANMAVSWGTGLLHPAPSSRPEPSYVRADDDKLEKLELGGEGGGGGDTWNISCYKRRFRVLSRRNSFTGGHNCVFNNVAIFYKQIKYTENIQLTRIVRYLQVFIISLNVNTVCHCLSCFINCSQHATVWRSVKGKRVLDVLNTNEELQHSLETQTKPSSGSWSLPPHVKIPVQTMITDAGESGCEAEVTMFSQTASTQLSHPGHQEIHSTHQTIISLIRDLLTQYLS